MGLFSFKKKSLEEGDAEFRKKLSLANRLINDLDFQIADFKRKFQTLQMHGPRALSVSDLEWQLKSMHALAEQAQAAVNDCEIQHANCVDIVDGMVKDFEKYTQEIEANSNE